ncbi:flagellar protein FlaG [Paenibacillus endoradicis]|uniref:flagellar protein FlaG n=1 Tax=Paenibacillus endoradicis TaxID=2972487 RepID=UPI002159324E|nr:flagellar protein FlaG [Paenibacillus endoradicis]MCR8660506.1 flagellar protein FlaG [Paenibacillus endoradicis]
MISSINGMEGSSIDWSQLNALKKHPASENRLSGSSTQAAQATQAANGTTSQLSQQDKEKLYKEVEKVNGQLELQNRALRFKFSDEAEQFYVEVIDSRTNEVIDSIPGKHMIELAAKLKDMIGFFIDEKL